MPFNSPKNTYVTSTEQLSVTLHLVGCANHRLDDDILGMVRSATAGSKFIEHNASLNEGSRLRVRKLCGDKSDPQR